MAFPGSITNKFIVISIILLSVLGSYLFIDLSTVRHLSSESVRINFVSQLRSRFHEMAWLAQRVVDGNAEKMDEATRRGLTARLRGEIETCDRLLIDLADGNRQKGLERLRYEEALALLSGIAADWSGNMRPALVALADLPPDPAEEKGRYMLGALNKKIVVLTERVQGLVMFLDNDYYEEIREYERRWLYISLFFLIAAGFVILFVRKSISKPLKSLQNAANEIRKGNYDVRMEVTSRDEIGALGQAFNRMADEIAGSFREVMWHTEDIMALNRALHKFAGIQKEEDLYKGICKHAHELFGLRMAWLGLLNEQDRDIRIVAGLGFEEGQLSRIRVTWDESEFGMGPEGIAIKTNLPQIINDMELADASLPGIKEALRQGYRSCMALPLICADCAVIGVMGLYSGQKDHFTANLAELCQIYVNQAASVIENVILLKDLEARVQERTEKLRDALLLAEGANAAKSAFLANMSHDLRTPLNAIIGFSEAMSQGIYGEVRPDHKEYLEYIYQSGMKLLKLINEVLDLSRMETGGMELDYGECNIGDMINNAVYIFREKAKKHRIGITVDIAEDVKVLTVDQLKIKQVLVNLLTDSLNATPDNGTILIQAARVSCNAAGVPGLQESGALIDKKPKVPERDCIQVVITDSRAALTNEERLRFFDPYKQFNTTLERRQDSIGLLLSRRFVELHGGRIWAEGLPTGLSEGGSSDGNRFIFVLPQQP